jgi:hypothetical protein
VKLVQSLVVEGLVIGGVIAIDQVRRRRRRARRSVVLASGA